MSTQRYELYIDGAWRAPANGEYAPNRNPANTDDVIGEFAMAAEADVQAAAEAAARAFPAWRATPMVKRGDLLHKAANLLEARLEDVARAMTREEGKTLPEARGETARGVAILRYYAGEASQPDGETYPTALPNRLLFTRREPLGVVGAICPWNFPVAIPLWKVAPALVYGNTVLLKAAELTPLTAWHIADVLHQAGLPNGVFNLVTGRGDTAGQAIADHPSIAAVTFTGSTRVGKALRLRVMARGGKVQAEMGGKNPVIVLDDADLNTAVEMVTRGAMRSTGQKCTATSRVYVQKGIFGTFADALAARVRGLKVGDGIAADTYLGPSVSAAQRDIVMDYIQVGQREGAKIAAGGEPFQESDHAKGYFVPPTVFVDAPPNARIMREEIFGPVVALAAVDTLDTALKAANDIPYGLSASLISRDIGQIMRFIDGIQAGLVHVNDETAGAEPQVPFGGFKESGTFGREQGKTAREFYTQVKTVYMDYPG